MSHQKSKKPKLKTERVKFVCVKTSKKVADENRKCKWENMVRNDDVTT